MNNYTNNKLSKAFSLSLTVAVLSLANSEAQTPDKSTGPQPNTTPSESGKSQIPGDRSREDRQSSGGLQTAAFIKKAAQGGIMEVKMGRLALERGQDPAVKQFGQTLITDHTRANQKLTQLAQLKGVTLPPDIQKQLRDVESPAANAGSREGTGGVADNAGRQPQTGAGDKSGSEQVREAPKPTANTRDESGPREDRDRAGKPKDAGEWDHAEGHQAMTSLHGLTGAAFDKALIAHAVKDHEKDIKLFEEASQSSIDPEVKAFASETLPTLRKHLQMARSLASGSTQEKTN